MKKYLKTPIVDSKLFRMLFIVFFLFYYGGTTLFFTHSHYVDGREVTHSHPYSDSDHHTHTKTEFQIISTLSNFIFIIGTISVVFITNLFDIQYVIRNVEVFSQKKYKKYNFRAPPIFN